MVKEQDQNPEDLAADGTKVPEGVEAPTEEEQLEYLQRAGWH